MSKEEKMKPGVIILHADPKAPHIAHTDEPLMLDFAIQYATHQGGNFVIGARDPHKLAENIIHKIESVITPHIAVAVNITLMGEMNVVYIRINRSAKRPHFYTKVIADKPKLYKRAS